MTAGVGPPCVKAYVASSPPSAPAGGGRSRVLGSLENEDWRRLWLAGHLWNISFWLELVILTWLTLELTDSPFLVGLVGTLRFLPEPVVGLLAGAQADRFPKRRLLLVAQAMNIVSTYAMLAAAITGALAMPYVYAAALVTGCAWAIDFPVRRAFIRDLVSDHHIVNAMALDGASLTGMVMLGRWTAGGVLALQGPLLGYAVLAVFYTGGFVLLLRVRSTPVVIGEYRASLLRSLVEGGRTVWSSPVLRAVFFVTLTVNLIVFPYFSFAPVFARDVFGVGQGWLGFMSGMDGLGAVIGSMVLAALPLVRRGLVLILGAIILSVGITAYAFSPTFIMALPLLAIAGVGIAGFATMQNTIVVSEVPAAMRGRAMGVMMLALGILPLGILWVGWLIELVGVRYAVGLNSAASAAVLLVVLLAARRLRTF